MQQFYFVCSYSDNGLNNSNLLGTYTPKQILTPYGLSELQNTIRITVFYMKSNTYKCKLWPLGAKKATQLPVILRKVIMQEQGVLKWCLCCVIPEVGTVRCGCCFVCFILYKNQNPQNSFYPVLGRSATSLPRRCS